MLEKMAKLRFKELNTPSWMLFCFFLREIYSVKLSGLLISGLALIAPAKIVYSPVKEQIIDSFQNTPKIDEITQTAIVVRKR